MQDRNYEVHQRGNTDKIERYDWKLLDQPGELRMLNKNALLVDEHYQREEIETKVREIARAWSWRACLARRTDFLPPTPKGAPRYGR